MRYAEKWPTYAKQWDGMTIKPARVAEFDRYARRLLAHKAEYHAIEDATGVPWWLVAVLHLRESDANFTTYLGNGQSLARKTTVVPIGRGPFKSFFDGAVDALRIDGLSSIKDWRLEKALYYCELFNGPGYHNRGLPAPYVWGGTSIQKPGKFVRDHVFSDRVMDPQPGCAPIIATIAKLDPSVTFARET
jgi:lysozyme family protein